MKQPDIQPHEITLVPIFQSTVSGYDFLTNIDLGHIFQSDPLFLSPNPAFLIRSGLLSRVLLIDSALRHSRIFL